MRRAFLLFTICTALHGAQSIQAQESPRPRAGHLVAEPAAAELLTIRAARMLDVTSGEIVSPALVVVRNDRIAQVGGEAPAGATEIDLGDVTVPSGADGRAHPPARQHRRRLAHPIRDGDQRGPGAARRVQRPYDAVRRLHHGPRHERRGWHRARAGHRGRPGRRTQDDLGALLAGNHGRTLR